jgi:CubicO group peptidase (beta-lactamase class C family)
MKTTNQFIYRMLIPMALAILLAANATAQDPTPKFDQYMNAVTSQQKFSGSVLAARDGKIIFSKGYGLANAELDVANAPQTKFRLGSITKQFTATSILLLQERGKLNVTDAICKYIDNCPPAWSEVTIHHLLSHTGGVPNFTSFPDYLPKMMMRVTTQEMIARFKDKPLDFKPGEKWSYSNSGYFLLGAIIEKVSGESYEGFLQKNIFDPLKMTGSGYDHFETILKNRATGYSMIMGKMSNSAFLDMTQPYSAGSLYSTVEDLFTWNEALYSGKVLSANSFEAMTTPVKNNYGYGLGIDTKNNHKMIAHGGGINGFSTFLVRFPEDKLTVVVLRNSDYGLANPGKIAQDLAAIVLGEKYEIPRAHVEIHVESKILDAYVGKYKLGSEAVLTITKEGDQLMAQVSGQPKIALFAESETTFFPKVVDLTIKFEKDATGKVTKLVLHQGLDRLAEKIE